MLTGLCGLFWLCTISCKERQPVKPYTASGLVIAQFYIYSPKTKSFIKSETDVPSTKTWYKDSIVIQERLGLRGHTSVDGTYKRWVELIGYTLIDLRRGWFYHYKTFTDTAALVGKWEQNDSASFAKYGWTWTFYNENQGLMAPAREPLPLSDTVRMGIHYKRFIFPRTNRDSSKTWFVAYFQCDRKGTFFQLNKALSRKMGCPLTRYETIPQDTNSIAVAEEVEFVRDSLTAAELKVFAAWEKKARESPVIR